METEPCSTAVRSRRQDEKPKRERRKLELPPSSEFNIGDPMPNLKSTVSRIRVRFPQLNSIRRWRAEHRASRAPQHQFTDHAADPHQPCYSDCHLRRIGFVPHAEMAAWRCRFFAAALVYLVVLIVCWLSRGGSL